MISHDGHVYGFDTRSSEPRWVFEAGEPMCSNPAYFDGRLYFGLWDGRFLSVDIDSRQIAWSFETNGKMYSSPSVNEEVIVFGNFDHHIYAIDRMTGRERWRFRTDNEIGLSSPAIYHGTTFIGSRDGCVYAIDIESGSVRWKFDSGSAVDSSPVIAEGLVHFGNESALFVLDHETGYEVTRYKAPAGSCVLDRGTAYVPSGDSVLSIS
ncbi:MAG: PQQ-like beta-propeller repeat protein [Gemmatimonadetes bacterium]|nr:PQQ-like beta-propeller repeat protein [Gemmatimonadota bacterium]